MNDEIILRSVYGKVGQKYFIQPCADPKTKRFPNCVKSVDKDGDMDYVIALNEKEEVVLEKFRNLDSRQKERLLGYMDALQ